MKRAVLQSSIVTLLSGFLFIYQPATAQKVQVSPVPQQEKWSTEVAFNRPVSVNIKAPKNIDKDALKALTNTFPKGKDGVKVILGKRGDKSVKAFESKIPNQAESYYLSVTPESVTIAGNDDTGLYYGVKSFLQIASQPQVMQVEISDWPSIPLRGVIEGFYGNPWSNAERADLFRFYGDNKMNIYVYGPKDDPYHRNQWFDPYPAEMAQGIRQLVSDAHANKVKFVWAMSPANSIFTEEDRTKALAKFEQMYDLGVRSFAIFFDDIEAKSVDAQIDYMNFLTDKFVKAHNDVEPLIVCPTQYNQDWAQGDYLPKMGQQLAEGISIMWTGKQVLDMINREDADWIIGQTGRKPFIWLNYPVNDYGNHHLLMGQFYGNDNNLDDALTAFCSNPMQYAEANKVALYSVADYAWNPQAYDPAQSWERAIPVIAPGHVEAFRTFCLNNVDVGDTWGKWHFLGETPSFRELMEKCPELTPESAPLYAAEFRTIAHAAAEIIKAEDEAPIYKEIKEFAKAMLYQGLRGLETVKMYQALQKADKNAYLQAFDKYQKATEAAEALVSKGFEGSIQPVKPLTGTLYVEPFIRSQVDKLTAASQAMK